MAKSKESVRNLRQYQELSDEEFDIIYRKIEDKSLKSKEFETRVQERLKSFSEDYDIDDLKVNDMGTLDSLIRSMIALEDYEQYTYRLQRDMMGNSESNEIEQIRKVSSIMNNLRADISKMQEDLKITRRIRKGDREESVLAYIDNLKDRAKQFYESRYARVFCPKCKMFIGSVWVLYPESSKNKFWFYCDRCDEKVILTYPELVENGMKNIEAVPEF